MPFVYCLMDTLTCVFFFEFIDNSLLLCSLPRPINALLHLWASGHLGVVLSSHRTCDGLHSDWDYSGIQCLLKKQQRCIVINYPKQLGTRTTRKKVACRSHKAIHCPWIDGVSIEALNNRSGLQYLQGEEWIHQGLCCIHLITPRLVPGTQRATVVVS